MAQSPTPDPDRAPAPANGSADGEDPFAEDIEALLRDAPETPPGADLWRRIERALPPSRPPAKPGGR